MLVTLAWWRANTIRCCSSTRRRNLKLASPNKSQHLGNRESVANSQVPQADFECFIALNELKNLAQGFNPGNHQVRRFALKGERSLLVRCVLITHSI